MKVGCEVKKQMMKNQGLGGVIDFWSEREEPELWQEKKLMEFCESFVKEFFGNK